MQPDAAGPAESLPAAFPTLPTAPSTVQVSPPPATLLAPQPFVPSSPPRQEFPFSFEEDKAAKDIAILVVDDSEANRDIVGRMLSLRGYRADFAASGNEAISLAAAKSYKVVFMDSYMPGMDGQAATRILRTSGLSSRAFIVGMSAKIGDQELEKCRQSGMDDLLAKPFTLKQLIAFLERARP